MSKYVVVENTPGYMPDSDPGVFDTIEEAKADAAALAENCDDDYYEGAATIREEADGMLFYVSTDEEHDLGRVIEVMEVPDEAADLLE